MFHKLPTELLYLVFDQLDSPSDHLHFSTASKQLYHVSSTLKQKLFLKYFNTLENHQQCSDSLFQELCKLVWYSDIKPTSNHLLTVLEHEVQTKHLKNFKFTNNQLKAEVLNLFRSNTSRTNDKLLQKDILISNTKLVTSKRQLTLHGPRRIYFDVSLLINNRLVHFKYLFYDLYSVIGFADDEQLTAHEGVMQFKDEQLTLDLNTLESLFQYESNQTINQTISVPNVNSTQKQPKPIVPDTRFLTLNKTPANWSPCLLTVYQNCTLNQYIKKGGLQVDSKFEHVFIYEHKQDDSICIEFSSKQKGYLLLTEHAIHWSF